jgi:hypothetical protein
MKRKKADDEDSMEVDGPEEGVRVTRKMVKRTATEMVEKLLMEVRE